MDRRLPDRPPHRFLHSSLIRWFLVGLTLLYVGLFLANSLTRTRYFSADSYTYVDVARNLVQGRGLVQSTLVIGQPMNLRSEGGSSAPFFLQPPLYPILIGLVGPASGSYPDGALIVPALGLLAILGLSFLFSQTLYDELTGWLAIGLLVLTPQLALISRFAWSESSGIACVLLVLWLLAMLRSQGYKARSSQTGEANSPAYHRVPALILALSAGMAAGLAFDTRYALGVLLPFGMLYLLLEQRLERKSWLSALVFAGGWLLVASPVLFHNLNAAGSLLPSLPPSDQGWLTNLSDAFYSIFGIYFPPQEFSPLQLITPLAFLLLIGLFAYRQGRIKSYFTEILIQHGRWLLVGWILVFSLTMITQRSLGFFDPLGSRLMSPASIPLMICAAALIGGLFSPARQELSLLLVALALIIACAREIILLAGPPAQTEAQYIETSPRLAWVRDHTTAQDMLIGDTLSDIPFYLGRPAVVSYSAFPYTERLSLGALQSLVERNCSNFENFYLLTGVHPGRPREHREHYGEFISDLMNKNENGYAQIALLAELADSRIFQLAFCP